MTIFPAIADICSGGIATSDTKRGDYAIKKGDFISVLEVSNGKALGKHADDPEHAEVLPKKLADAGVKMTTVEQLVYKTSGRGFMNRTSSEAGQPQGAAIASKRARL